MVTTEFKKNAYEGYDEAQNEVALATGNAFAPDQMKRETINALQNAMMNGADDDSSIATAAMKLSGHFKSSASKQNDKKDKGLSMGEMAILQQSANNLLQSMQERQEEIGDQLDALGQIEQLMNSGEFDPENKDHLALLQIVDESMTAGTWDAMSDSQKRDWIDDNREELKIESAALDLDMRAIEQLAQPNVTDLTNAIPATNNKFDSEMMENAALEWEADKGLELDRHNLTEEIIRELDIIVSEQRQEAVQQTIALDELSGKSNELAGLVGMDFQIKL